MSCVVDAGSFRSGTDLPMVSVVSGSEADIELVQVRAVDKWIDEAPLVALVLGPISAILVALSGKTSVGYLPMASSEARLRRCLIIARRALVVFYLAGLAFLLFFQPPFGLDAVAGAFVYLVPLFGLVFVVATQSRIPRVIWRGDHVEVVNPSDEFSQRL